MLSRFVVSQVKHNSYFIVGVVLGLWITLAVVPLEDEAAIVACPVPSEATADEFEPHREERPLGPAGPAAGRSVQRPRYYTTELGIRGSLMSGVLSSEEALRSRGAALNQTASRLQPLRLFVSAAAGAAPPRPNVVGFTDSREMLKPFNTLKYLADNYLEEYDFFFLVSDASFVNARRLQELVSRLSVSQDLYMGTVAEDDSHYCTLEGGILLSNSVLRAVHPELDWCVRNAYSAHHHENLGRCVLHAAQQRCTAAAAGEEYLSVRLEADLAPGPALAAAVTAYPVTQPAAFYALHAYVSRVYLERDAAEVARLRGQLARTLPRHPPAYRNTSWPAGLRADPGLPPPAPPTRFDHLRWSWFNSSHVLQPDEHRAVGPLAGAHADAVQLVVDAVRAWGERRWGGDADAPGRPGGPPEGAPATLLEGAWRWEPPHALRYRLLLRHKGRVRLVEAARVLGAARVVRAPYVTESARLTVVQARGVRGVEPAPAPAPAPTLLRRLLAPLQRDGNAALLLMLMVGPSSNASAVQALKDAAAALPASQRGAGLELVELPLTQDLEQQQQQQQQPGGDTRRRALELALARLPRHALVLLLPPDADYNQDFLNRARMNSILGVQWFWAGGFTRYAQAALTTGRAAHPSGHFRLGAGGALAFYRADYDAAVSSWKGSASASVEEILTASGLRCLQAPEPALVLPPPPPPPPASRGHPSAAPPASRRLALGDRHTLARILLEDQANLH